MSWFYIPAKYRAESIFYMAKRVIVRSSDFEKYINVETAKMNYFKRLHEQIIKICV